MERLAESCCHHVPACHVFLAVQGTRRDAQFHRVHRRTEADSDDNQACQLPPNGTKLRYRYPVRNMFKQLTISHIYHHIVIAFISGSMAHSITHTHKV